MNVILKYAEEWLIMPFAIILEDGRKYEIDKVTTVDKRPNDVGRFGTRYKCRILWQMRNIFFDELNKKWFAETRIRKKVVIKIE